MDPITAVSLAGTILQLIELGVKVGKRVTDFSSAVDDVPRSFKLIHTKLPLILDGLRKFQSKTIVNSADKETQESLIPVIKGCLAEIEQLDNLLEKALPSASNSPWERRMKAVKSLAYDKKIEEIAESLDRYTNALIFHQSRDVAFDVSNPEIPIIIPELDKTEGLNLVRKRLRGNYPEDLVLELLQELESIPLAITQAIAFMVKRQRTIQQYLEQYRRSDATKAKFLNYEFSDHARPDNTLESVAKTWRLSFESIRDSNRRAADLLCLINFFQHHGIPAILLQDDVEDDFDFQEAAALLKAFSFIDEKDSVFSTHRLVQLATRSWLEEEVPGDVDRWAFEALKSIASQFPEASSQPEPEYFRLAEILLPHAELILQHQFKKITENSELAKAKLLASSGRYLVWNGNYDEARLRFKRSSEINEKYLGEKHVDTMASMGLLGWIQANRYGDVRSVSILKQVVQNRREVLGEDDPKTIDSLSDLATGIALTGDYALSENMQREALERSERILGKRHDDTLNCMGNLAQVLKIQGKSEEAIKLLRDAYEAKKDFFGQVHQSMFIFEYDLALMLCRDSETVEEGLSLLRRCFRHQREVNGPNHSDALATAVSLIYILIENDWFTEACELCEQCLAETRDGPYKNIHRQRLLEITKHLLQEQVDTIEDRRISVARERDTESIEANL